MNITVANKSIAVQSFEFSKHGWINLFVDFLQELEPVRKKKASCRIGLKKGCEPTYRMGGKINFNRNGQELCFDQVDVRDFLMNEIPFTNFKSFVTQNFEAIKEACIKEGNN